MTKENNNVFLEEPYSFYAFISYRHANLRWGKWIQRSLEAYRLPSELCSERNVPSHISPIFRDETDLTGGNTVYALLDEKLRQSKFLIVVCSRDLAQKPKYIDYEIRKFLENNTVNHIIPVVVDGVPKSGDPETECFPPELLKLGDNAPLAVNIQTVGRKEALLKLVAILLGIELSSLRSHDKVRVQKLAFRIALASCILLLGLTAFFVWQLFSVRQAKLHEQVVYADKLYESGDKLRSLSLSRDVLDAVLPLMDSSIAEAAEELCFLNCFRPLFSPVTHLENNYASNTLFFDNSGKYVISQTKTSIAIYTLDGEPSFRFDLGSRGLQIECVSPDGIHAVLLRYSGRSYYTQLVLWDLLEDAPVAVLAEGTRYDIRDASDRDFSNLLDACFSPDGRIVSAYHRGGYFDPNNTLNLFSADTGELLCSLDGSLLGTREEDGVQDGVVEEFAFLDNETAYWKGGAYHVFYSIPLEKTYRIPLSLSADFKKRFDRSPWLGCFAPLGQEDRIALFDFRSFESEALSYILGESTFYIPDYQPYGGKYVVSCTTELVTPPAHFSRLYSVSPAPCVSTVLVGDFLSEDAFYVDVLNYSYSEYEFLTSDSPVCYVWLKNSITGKSPLLVRLDPIQKSLRSVGGIDRYQKLTLVGCTDDNDYFVALTETGTELLCISASGTLSAVRIDAPYSSLCGSSLINGYPENGKMLGLYRDDYCLFELSPAAYTLCEANSINSLYAVDSSGHFLIWADNTNLSWWKDSEPYGSYQLDWSPKAIGIAADGRWFAACTDRLLVCNEAGELLWSVDGQKNLLCPSVKLSEDGSLLCWLTQSSAFVPEVCTLHSVFPDGGGEKTYTPLIHWDSSYPVSDAYDISPDASCIAIIEHQVVQTEPKELYVRVLSLLSTASGERMAVIPKEQPSDTEPSFFTGVRFQSRDQLLACSSSTVTLYNVADLSRVWQLNSISRYSNFPVLLPDETLLFPGKDLEIWDVGSGTILQTIPLESEGQVGLFLSDNCKWLALSSSDTALYHIRDMKKRAEISSLPLEILRFTEDELVCFDGRSVIRFIL